MIRYAKSDLPRSDFSPEFSATYSPLTRPLWFLVTVVTFTIIASPAPLILASHWSVAPPSWPVIGWHWPTCAGHLCCLLRPSSQWILWMLQFNLSETFPIFLHSDLFEEKPNLIFSDTNQSREVWIVKSRVKSKFWDTFCITCIC